MKEKVFHYLQGDRIIWIIAIILGMISILAVYSSISSLAYKYQEGNTFHFLLKHLIMLLAGYGIMYAVHKMPHRYIFRISQLMIWVSAALLLFTLLFGSNINAANRWLTIPIILLARIGFLLQNVAHAATDTFASRSSWGVFVGRTIAGIITIISWLFLAIINIAQYISNAVGKGAEFKADETVVSMGFGRQLLNSLRIVVSSGNGERATHWRDRLVTSHPPARTRIARIEAQLRQMPRGNRR